MNRLMGREIDFVVKGRPIPHPRPSVSNRGGAVRVYYKANGIEEYRAAIIESAAKYYLHPWAVPLEVEMEFCFQRPASHYNADGSLSSSGRCQLVPPRADVDNLVKGVLDALNGLAYTDDNLVASIKAVKRYCRKERTYITLRKLVIDE